LAAGPVTPLIPVVVVFQIHFPVHVPLTPLVQLEPFGPLESVQVPVPVSHVHEKVPVTFLDEVAEAGWLKHSEDTSIAQAMRATPAVSIIRIWPPTFPSIPGRRVMAPRAKANALIPRNTVGHPAASPFRFDAEVLAILLWEPLRQINVARLLSRAVRAPGRAGARRGDHPSGSYLLPSSCLSLSSNTNFGALLRSAFPSTTDCK
jgi:hypothetical protein